MLEQPCDLHRDRLDERVVRAVQTHLVKVKSPHSVEQVYRALRLQYPNLHELPSHELDDVIAVAHVAVTLTTQGMCPRGH